MMKVFSGSSNEPLANKVSKISGLKLGKVELNRFANREVKVRIREKKVSPTAIVVQSLSNPPDEHLVEFALICDALQRLGASKIVAVIPWLAYSKQDKVFQTGEPLSVKVIARMLQVVKLDKLLTIDLHNPSILGFFEVPVVNLSTQELFLNHFSSLDKKDLIVVAPDAGAVKDSTAFALKLGVDVAYVDKKRDLESGKVTIKGIAGNVKGKQILMLDDMIVTGSTIIETCGFLRKKGVGKILVGATHNLYLPGVTEELESCTDQLVITDTIQKPKEVRLIKTKVLSVAGMIASSVKQLIKPGG